jgi:cytochrome b6-f complex iron-sulfur subunit
MATANPAKSDAASRASIARTAPESAVAQAQPAVSVAAPSRREFLYYIWGASIALMLGQFGAATIWFAFPRFREGEFGGVFPFDPVELPSTGDAPFFVASGRFHVAHTDGGVMALYGVCTHLGCLPKWAPTNERFECPCHGSKYRADGTWIEGPAPRGLDHFPVRIVYSDGTEAESAGLTPIVLAENKQIVRIEVNTGRRILGPGHDVTAL